MLTLNTIKKQPGATTSNKRRGRGQGSGLGATAGKGDKGQLARTGGHSRVGFEGGQMPLYRRIPKRGFHNFARRSIAVLNVGDLERLDPKQVGDISLENLVKVGMVKGRYDQLTILGTGELKKAFVVKAHKVSPSATDKITKAGGKVEILVIPTMGPGKKKKKRVAAAATK